MTSSTSSSNSVAAVNSDRISGMQDDVLLHILSFLPTIMSAKTSILSRRWRFLWAYAPDLIFETDDDVDIVYRVMLLHRTKSINTLRMTRCFPCTDLQFDTWIAYAVMRKVRNLDLWVEGTRILPQCLLNCETLVDLRLSYCCVIPDAGTVYLPRLKNLHLIEVEYESDESLPRLLSGCTQLEEFVLKSDEELLSCYKISSPTIERLTVHFYLSDATSYECRLVINTPALGYLQICDEIYRLARNPESQEHTQTGESKFFAGTVSFPTLTKLELDADCFLVSQFLKNADNLEILIFNEVSEEKKSYVWVEPLQVPKCLLSHLKVIKFVNTVDKMNNFEMVKFLLKNARVLEEMDIIYSKTSDTEEKVREIVLLCKRCRVTRVEVVKL
ncbi:hypothetical protein MIMGU_mgv1a017889mg [Erythranthe guttata]|uniref:FBD domain-containing protein n=1 Tax=Erythranthe guttata TaxID=4155 RepID=A0A022QQX7_ERYGU|nr:hypothetical protein MIMGU_mgv1a017889mg [Erythranthe guttata]